MKKLLLLTAALSPILGFAAKPAAPASHVPQISLEVYGPVKKSFAYVEMSAEIPLPFPGVTVGYREIYKNHGLDASLGVISCHNITDFSANLRYINYFTKGRKYVAAGLSADWLFSNAYELLVFSPTVSYGKDYDKTFHQFDLAVLRFSDWQMELVSAVTYRYGIKF